VGKNPTRTQKSKKKASLLLSSTGKGREVFCDEEGERFIRLIHGGGWGITTDQCKTVDPLWDLEERRGGNPIQAKRNEKSFGLNIQKSETLATPTDKKGITQNWGRWGENPKVEGETFCGRGGERGHNHYLGKEVGSYVLGLEKVRLLGPRG